MIYLKKIIDVLSKYNLSPFHLEEVSKELVEKITNKSLSERIPKYFLPDRGLGIASAIPSAIF